MFLLQRSIIELGRQRIFPLMTLAGEYSSKHGGRRRPQGLSEENIRENMELNIDDKDDENKLVRLLDVQGSDMGIMPYGQVLNIATQKKLRVAEKSYDGDKLIVQLESERSKKSSRAFKSYTLASNIDDHMLGLKTKQMQSHFEKGFAIELSLRQPRRRLAPNEDAHYALVRSGFKRITKHLSNAFGKHFKYAEVKDGMVKASVTPGDRKETNGE